MIQYFINRAGKNLSATRRRELERAKRLLQQKRATRKRSRSHWYSADLSIRSWGSEPADSRSCYEIIAFTSVSWPWSQRWPSRVAVDARARD